MRRRMRGSTPLHASSVLVVGAITGCSRPTSTPPPGEESAVSGPRPTWCATMGEVGRRFELVGRAATAGRMELARYHVGEIEEVFEDTLTHAEPPREGQTSVLQPMRATFLQTNVPELRRVLDARDRQGFVAAFERTAAESRRPRPTGCDKRALRDDTHHA